MGYQRVSVELSDAALAKIDAEAAALGVTRDAVVEAAVDGLATGRTGEPAPTGSSRFRAALDRLEDRIRTVPVERSIEDIDAQVRENRGDR